VSKRITLPQQHQPDCLTRSVTKCTGTKTRPTLRRPSGVLSIETGTHLSTAEHSTRARTQTRFSNHAAPSRAQEDHATAVYTPCQGHMHGHSCMQPQNFLSRQTQIYADNLTLTEARARRYHVSLNALSSVPVKAPQHNGSHHDLRIKMILTHLCWPLLRMCVYGRGACTRNRKSMYVRMCSACMCVLWCAFSMRAGACCEAKLLACKGMIYNIYIHVCMSVYVCMSVCLSL
jgi:hypothetical protein